MRAPPAIALLVFLALGCAQLGSRLPWPWPRQSGSYSEQQLREDLLLFARRFEVTLSAVTDVIADESDSRAVRRRALLAKVRLIPLVRDAALIDDVQQAFASVATLVVTLRNYMVEGEGRRGLGGDERPVEVAREFETAIFEIGARFLGPEELARLREGIESLAREHPIRGPDFAAEAVGAALAEVDAGLSLSWLVNLPMTPLRTLEGVTETAPAIREFTRVAAAFSKVVASIPQQARWEIELLLYDFEDRDTTVAALAAFERVAESTSRAAASFERVPEDLRGLLGDAEPTLARTEETLATGRALAVDLTAAAEQVAAAGTAWAALVGPRDGAEPGRPFDVREYQSAAGEIRAASTELRGLAVELRALLESPGLERALETGVKPVEAGARELVDHAARRALWLLLAFFGLLLLYRLVASRLAPRAPGRPG